MTEPTIKAVEYTITQLPQSKLLDRDEVHDLLLDLRQELIRIGEEQLDRASD